MNFLLPTYCQTATDGADVNLGFGHCAQGVYSSQQFLFSGGTQAASYSPLTL